MPNFKCLKKSQACSQDKFQLHENHTKAAASLQMKTISKICLFKRNSKKHIKGIGIYFGKKVSDDDDRTACNEHLLPALKRECTLASWNSISSTICDPPIVQTNSNFKYNGSHGDRNSAIKGLKLYE